MNRTIVVVGIIVASIGFACLIYANSHGATSARMDTPPLNSRPAALQASDK